MVPEAPVKKRRAVGVWSFVLGFLAALSHLGILVTLIFAVGSAFGGFGDGDVFQNLLGGLAGLAGLVLLASVVFIAALVFAVISVILALVAFVRRSGPVFAVFGLLFSLGVIGVSLTVFGAIGSVPDLFSGSF